MRIKDAQPSNRTGRRTANPFILLETAKYALAITQITQQRGYEGPYLHLVMTEPQTGKEIHDNRSFVAPWAIEELVEAAGLEREDTYAIDWEDPQSFGTLLGTMILGNVYSEEFPIGSGRFRNKLGRVEQLPADQEDQNESGAPVDNRVGVA